jgi:hypothetical protein
MVAIKRAIEPYERKKAKERQQEHGNTVPGNKKENTSVNLTEVTKGNTSDKAVGFVGVSRNTLKKTEEIVNAAETNPERY